MRGGCVSCVCLTLPPTEIMRQTPGTVHTNVTCVLRKHCLLWRRLSHVYKGHHSRKQRRIRVHDCRHKGIVIRHFRFRFHIGGNHPRCGIHHIFIFWIRTRCAPLPRLPSLGPLCFTWWSATGRQWSKVEVVGSACSNEEVPALARQDIGFGLQLPKSRLAAT